MTDDPRIDKTAWPGVIRIVPAHLRPKARTDLDALLDGKSDEWLRGFNEGLKFALRRLGRDKPDPG